MDVCWAKERKKMMTMCKDEGKYKTRQKDGLAGWGKNSKDANAGRKEDANWLPSTALGRLTAKRQFKEDADAG
jgi:hypothetical protein